MERCPWCGTDEIYIKYHDEEWGVPEHDDHRLFEMLCLEGAQAGLSLYTVLKKRENYRKAFDNFSPETIALYDKNKSCELVQNSGIIRNHLKIKSFIGNAQAYLNILSKHNSFDEYIWQFTDGKTIINEFRNLRDLPPKTEISDEMSKILKRDGFTFVGSTICYAFMQATGMVNDHLITCFRYKDIGFNL
jgi:DNA-3-methyladenine glycosylase I